MIIGLILAILGIFFVVNEYYGVTLVVSSTQLNLSVSIFRTIVGVGLGGLGVWLFKVGVSLFIAPSHKAAVRSLRKHGI